MKRYILSAEITITEIDSPDDSPRPRDSNETIDRLAGMATRVLGGGPIVFGPSVQPNCYRMSKSVELSGHGNGFATVAETMKRVNETLDQISIDTV